jgi:hypothetical protein
MFRFRVFNSTFKTRQEHEMKITRAHKSVNRSGKVRYALAFWLLGLPIPLVILALLFGGCNF